MKASDLKVKTKDELQSILTDLRKEQFNLRFQKTSGQLENTARIRLVRRDIARVMTFLNQGPEEASKESGKKAPASKKTKKSAAKKPAKKTAKTSGKKAAAKAKTGKKAKAAKKKAK